MQCPAVLYIAERTLVRAAARGNIQNMAEDGGVVDQGGDVAVSVSEDTGDAGNSTPLSARYERWKLRRQCLDA